MPLITLTTDFGCKDPYVAIMKGVILSITPRANIIDITHDIPPFNVVAAAHVLRSICPWFPSGTIHVVVVDPGVGTDRRILLARNADHLFLVPDNGVITYAHRDRAMQVVRIVENRHLFLSRVSNTFHGRDIFAPVAAHLAQGLKPDRVGRLTDVLQLLPPDLADLTIRADEVNGRVVYSDRFGNLVTNIHVRDLGPLLQPSRRAQVYLGEKWIGPILRCYGDAPPLTPLALIGSHDFIEIAVNQGSAAETFGTNDPVHIRASAGPPTGGPDPRILTTNPPPP